MASRPPEVLVTDGVLDSESNYCFVYLYNRKIPYRKPVQTTSPDAILADDDDGDNDSCIYSAQFSSDGITLRIFLANSSEEAHGGSEGNSESALGQGKRISCVVEVVEGEDSDPTRQQQLCIQGVESANIFFDMRKFKTKQIKRLENLLRGTIADRLKTDWTVSQIHLCIIKSKSRYIASHPYLNLGTILDEDPHKEYLESLHDMKPNRWKYASPKDIIKLHKVDKSMIRKRRFGKLPLHIAILMGAPYEVIFGLCELFPPAIKEIEYEDGYTPLHLAISVSQPREVVSFILSRCPTSMTTEDKYGEYPIHLVHNDDTFFAMMTYFVDKYDIDLNNNTIYTIEKEINSLNDEKLKYEIDLTSLKEEVEFFKVKLQKYKMKQNTAVQPDKQKRRLEKIRDKKENLKLSESKISKVNKILEEIVEQISLLQQKLEIQKKIKEANYLKLGKLMGCDKENKKGELPLLTAVSLGLSENAVKWLYRLYKKALYDTDKWGYNVIHVAAEKPEANDLLEALLTDYPIFREEKLSTDEKMKKSSYQWTRSLPIARNKLGYRPLDIARLHANQESGLTMILELRRRHVIKLRKLLKVCKQKQASLKTRLQLAPTRSADNKSQAVVDLKKQIGVWKRREVLYEKEIQYFEKSIEDPCIKSSLSVRKFCKCNSKIPCMVKANSSRTFCICNKHNYLTQANVPVRKNHKTGALKSTQYSCKSCMLVNFFEVSTDVSKQ